MELVWSIRLVVVILLALNYMAAGRASGIVRPVTVIVRGLLSLVIRVALSLIRPLLKLGARLIKLNKAGGGKKIFRMWVWTSASSLGLVRLITKFPHSKDTNVFVVQRSCRKP